MFVNFGPDSDCDDISTKEGSKIVVIDNNNYLKYKPQDSVLENISDQRSGNAFLEPIKAPQSALGANLFRIRL